jgi:hypothetical protein
MTNKNPYELRSDILHMAKEYLDEQMHLNIQYMDRMMQLGAAHQEDIKKAFTPYTMEDLIKKASEMYSFVSTKG